MTGVQTCALPIFRAGARDAHPIARLVRRRLAFGVLTLLLVSVVVFLATEVLPGNAAFAVLGRNANPARVRALENALHLNRGSSISTGSGYLAFLRAGWVTPSSTGSRYGARSSRGWSTLLFWSSSPG